MNYTKRIHQNAVDLLLNEYAIPSFCIHSNSAEMVGRADGETIIVISSLSDLGEGETVLMALRYIFEQSAHLLVLDNKDISTAKIEKVNEFRNDIVPNKAAFKNIKTTADNLLNYVKDELSYYELPKNYPDYYWQYELGEVKLSDAYDSLGLSKPYFYKLCELYEKTIHFYRRQWQTSVEIIQTPKKRVMDYEKMIEIITPFTDKGLTYEALSTLENELQLSWTDLWRSLLAMKKSRFYFYYLKNNPELKKKPLYIDINNALKVLNKNPNVFIQMGSIQGPRYMFPEERFIP
jgi:hypothetical protein